MKIAAFVVATALVLAFTSAGIASAGPGSSAVDINFVGYCDGLHLNMPSEGLGTSSTVDGYQTGCVSGGVFGTAKASANGHYGVEKGTEYITIPSYGTHTVIDANHTWVHYALSGNEIYVLNSGRWALGPPQAGSARPSNTARPAPPRAPQDSVREISFDGYCDGMELISPSVGLGVKRTVDGNRTGCATDALMGSKTLINEEPATYVVSFFADGVEWLQTAIFPDHTWIHFAVNGNDIYILNSGTWSRGMPQGKTGTSSTAA